MDKYGVAQEPMPTEKEAQEKSPLCPLCLGALQRRDTVNVLYCKECGTKPYEGKNASR